MKNGKNILVLLLGLVLMAPPAGWAGGEGPQVIAGIQLRHIYSSDIEATGGDIGITSSGFDLTYKFKVAGQLPVDISLDVGHKDINADTSVDLPSHLESRRLGFSTKFPAPCIQDERFFVGLDIFPALNTGDWNWEPGAFRIPFRGYLIFRENDDFILVGGVSVRPGYEREVLPVVGLIYRPDERLAFNFASDDPHISYKLNDVTLLRWEVHYAFDEYEVARGSQEGVVLQYQEISSGFGVEQQFNEHLKGILSLGGVFNRKLEYKDEVGKVAPDTGFYTSARITAVF